MARLKGMMSSKRALVLVSVVIMVSLAGMFPAFIFASPDSLTVRVSDIEKGINITTANVTLWNCSNPGQMLGYNTTDSYGRARIGITGPNPWNVSIRVNISNPNYFNKTDDNGGKCYLLSGDVYINEEVYFKNKGSFNVTVVDSVNGRPVPNVNVSVYREGAGTEDQAYNYRCVNGVCTTGDDGNMMLIASQGNTSPCGNFKISVTDEIPNYDDKNKSATGPCAGANRDVLVKVDGAQRVQGYITDKYNTEIKIAGANVTLWDHDSVPAKMFGWDNKYFYNGTTDAYGHYDIRIPSDMLCSEERCRYDVRVEADKYLTTYSEGENDIGYLGVEQIDLNLTGPLTVSGRAIDITNGRPVFNAEVGVYNQSEGFEYIVSTDAQGYFSLKIRNNTGYSVKLKSSGYGNNVTTSLGGSQSLGNITLRGKARVVGRIIDTHQDQGDSDIPLSATIAFDSGLYKAASNANGYFSIYVRSGVTYSVSVSKAGYFTSAFGFPVEQDPAGNVSAGTRELTGRHGIYGTVFDSEGSRATYDKLSDVDVLVHDSYHTYKVTTDTYGNYSVDVSSLNNDYYMEFQRNGFDTRIVDDSGSNFSASYEGSVKRNTQLFGSTTVTGKVADEHSPSGSTIPVPGAMMLFKHNPSSSNPLHLYNVTTDSNGYFSVNLGVTGDYDIVVSKSGYGGRTFDNLGSGYTAGSDISFNNVTNDYLRLRGTAHVFGIVRDNKSQQYVYNAIVTIYRKNSSQARYWRSVNGSYDFWVDGDMHYEIEADADGYPKRSDGGGITGYKGDLELNITLKAQFQAILKDAENAQGIRNSRVRLYHYYDQTYFGPDSIPALVPLNVTTLNVSVYCEEWGTSERFWLDDINVTLDKTDGCEGYQDTLGLCWRCQNTTNGSTLYDTVAAGTYSVIIDGSQIGCGNKTETLVISSADIGKQKNVSYGVEETALRVEVIDPVFFVDSSLGRLEDANVTIVNPGPHTNTTPENNSQGVFTFHFVRSVNANITAFNGNHFMNYSLYNLTPGILNAFPSLPRLVLQPHPANLSVLVLNSTGFAVDDGVEVNITNQSDFLVGSAFFSSHYGSTYNATTSGGWANFTDLYPSVYWNITLNGTMQGYNHTYINDSLLEPGEQAMTNVSVSENTLVVHVFGLSGGSTVPVEDARVILWDSSIGGSAAQDGTGNDLNATTNSTGGIFFNRMIPRMYNVSINGTGFVPFDTFVVVGINQNRFNPVLNDTTPPYYDKAWMSPASPEQGDTIRIYVHWNDNAILEQAILQLKYEDGSEQNHTYRAFLLDDWSNFTLDSDFTTDHAGENVSWKVIARDSSNNWNSTMPWSEFKILDTEDPVVFITHTPTKVVAGMEVVFQATASDNHNVSWLKIYVDYEDKSGEQECNVTGGGQSMVCVWKSTQGYDYDTKHYYYAIARDDDGNQGKYPAWELNETTGYAFVSGAGLSQGAAVYAGEFYPERIYTFGGRDTTSASDHVSVFFPSIPSDPSYLVSMTEERRAFAAAYDDDNGQIFIFGGSNGVSWLNSIERFSLSSNTLTPMTETVPSGQRNSPSAAYHTSGGYGYVYLFGGDNGTAPYSQNIWRYNITADSGSNVGNLPDERSKTAAVYSPVNGMIYIIGGRNSSSDIAEILQYAPGNPNGAQVAGSLPRALEGVSAAYHTKTDKIYIFGGYNFNDTVYSSEIYEFDPLTNSTSTMNSTLPTARGFSSAVFSDYDDKFYIFGGEAGAGYFNEIVRYDPQYGLSFTVQMRQGNLTVYVQSGGSPVTNCGGWPDVTLSYSGLLPNGKSFTDTSDDATGADARFEHLYPEITYDYEVNGTDQGYDYVSGTVFVDQGENNMTVSLDETNLLINVTNSSGAPVTADYNVFPQGMDPDNDILTRCDGTQVKGTTAADGTASYSRVKPCASCNLTVSKPGATPSWSSTLFSVTAGQDNYVHIDPPGATPSLGAAYPYYVDVIGDLNTLLINVTTNTTGNLTPLGFVNISLFRDDGIAANSSLTDVFGLCYIMVKDGVYNLSIDGEGRGYDSFMVENIKVGKLVFANGTTDSNGQVLLVVDGQPMYTPLEPHTPGGGYGYFARIETAGHGSYDSLADGIGVFQGTYHNEQGPPENYDVNNSFTLDMYGLSMINGTVTDKKCIYTNCLVPYVAVKLLVGVQGAQTRYTKTTDINGTYSVHVSPYTADSHWNSKITEEYDVRTVKNGYHDMYYSYGHPNPITLAEYENFTYDPGLLGSGYVSGFVYSHDQSPQKIGGANVRFVATTSPAANPNILPNSNYYSTVSADGTGAFSMDINPNYGPYKLSAEKNQSTFLARTVGPFTGNNDDIIIYLYRDGEGSIQFYVLDELGQGIEGASVLVTESDYTYFSDYTDQNGESKVWSIGGEGIEYDVTVNASYIGYGVNQSKVIVQSGKETVFNVTLQSTKINVTLKSDMGENVDGVTVELLNASGMVNYLGTTNGSAVFRILLPDEYSLNFTGYKSLVYFMDGVNLDRNTTYVNITDSDAGKTINVTYVLNETRLRVNLIDYNSSALPNITVFISNVTNASTIAYNATSDANGHALFREILPAHNYSITFNETELNALGLQMQLENFSIGVFGGEDEYTTNNITIVVGDVYVRFNVTDYLGAGIENVTISLELNGTVAVNGYNESLNGTTGINGILEIHGVPNRTYSFTIDANGTGYGIWNGSVAVTLNNEQNRVDIEDMYPLMLTVYVYTSSGGSIVGNVTATVFLGNALAENALGENLSANITSSKNYVDFTHLLAYPQNYAVNVTSAAYFDNSSSVTGFELMNPQITHKNLSLTVIKRSIDVSLFDYYGGVVENPSCGDENNLSIVNSTGDPVIGTNGSILTSDCYIFLFPAEVWAYIVNYIPDGTHYIQFTSSRFFSQNQSFNTSDILLGKGHYSFNLTERKISVTVRNSTGDVLEEGVNISIQNMTTGAVVQSLNGSYLNASGVTDSVNFTHVPDGEYKINVTSDRYFSDYQTFRTSDITPANYTRSFTMTERTVNIYLKDPDGSTLDHGVNVSLTNSSGGQVMGTNGSVIETRVGQTDFVRFDYVPDGVNFIVSVVSNDYFSQNWTFNTSDLSTNNTRTFTMMLRSLTVDIYHITGAVIMEDVTVSLVNGTGDVAKNTTGQFVNGTTDTGTISFGGLLDGNYNISVESANYTSRNITFDTAKGDNNEVDVYLLKKGHGYFNVTVLTTGGSPLSGSTVTVRFNDTADAGSGTTGSDGMAVVGVNATAYSQNLTVKVTRSGYYENETADYNLSDQEIKDVTVTLAAKPPPAGPTGGPGGPSRFVGGVVSETQVLGDVSANIAKSATFNLADTLGVERIEVLTKQDASDVRLTVRETGKPAGAPDPISTTEGRVQKYLDITATNLPNSIIVRVTITFKVSKTWADTNGIDPNSVVMFRYSDGAWSRLTTSMISQDDRYYYYAAVSPGFSIFAIGGYNVGQVGMSLMLSPLSLKGNDCKTVYITVKNVGPTALANIRADPKDTECCSIKPLKQIAYLSYGSQDTIPIEVCAGITTERGTYEYSMTVMSDQTRATVDSKVFVIESYLETLTSQIDELEALLDALNMTGLNQTQLDYYGLVKDKLDDSREYLNRHDYDSAITLLGEAREFYDKITAPRPPGPKGFLDIFLEWIIINYLLASLLGAIAVLALAGVIVKWKVIAKELPEMPEVPVPGGGEVIEAIKRSPDEIIDSIMGFVRDLEAKVDQIDLEALRDREKKWYHKVKAQIEGIKRSVDKGDFDKAKRNLNDAELFMKMLELNAASE